MSNECILAILLKKDEQSETTLRHSSIDILRFDIRLGCLRPWAIRS